MVIPNSILFSCVVIKKMLSISLVFLLTWYHTSYPTLRIGDIAFVARDEVHVAMEDGLTCCFIDVDAYIVTIWMESLFYLLLYILQDYIHGFGADSKWWYVWRFLWHTLLSYFVYGRIYLGVKVRALVLHYKGTKILGITKKSKEKTKFFLRGVINSDSPKRVSRFITPLARGVAICDGALGSIPKIIFVNFIIFVIFVISGIEVAYRSKEEGKLYKNY